MAFNHKWNQQMTPEDKQFYKELGKRIALARKASELTQVQLADKLGIAQQTMAHYEGGSLRIAVVMLKPLSEFLNTSVEELVSGTPSTKKKRGPSSKLEKQIEVIQQLPRAKQKFVTEMLDTVIQQTQ